MHKIWNQFLVWKTTYLTRWVTQWLKQWSNTLLLNSGKSRRRNSIIQCHTARMTRQKIFFSSCTVFRHSVNVVDVVFLLDYVHFSLSLYSLCVQKYYAWFFLLFSSPHMNSSRKNRFSCLKLHEQGYHWLLFLHKNLYWVGKSNSRGKKWTHGMKCAFKS